jgi:hypothetical protein
VATAAAVRAAAVATAVAASAVAEPLAEAHASAPRSKGASSALFLWFFAELRDAARGRTAPLAAPSTWTEPLGMALSQAP